MSTLKKVEIVVEEGGRLPEYATDGSAGADLFSSDDKVILPGERALIGTSIRVHIPEGFELQVRSRSGLSLKHGISVLNSPGTIDSDYRGEIGVVLRNSGEHLFKVTKGMRIAQLVLARVERISFVETISLVSTPRGKSGFGHTGL